MKYDLIIVGAGPAHIHTLEMINWAQEKILMIEKGGALNALAQVQGSKMHELQAVLSYNNGFSAQGPFPTASFRSHTGGEEAPAWAKGMPKSS